MQHVVNKLSGGYAFPPCMTQFYGVVRLVTDYICLVQGTHDVITILTNQAAVATAVAPKGLVSLASTLAVRLDQMPMLVRLVVSLQVRELIRVVHLTSTRLCV
jgi:hypothetical protein